LKKLLGMLRARAFLDSLGKCTWSQCPTPDLAIPKTSLMVCECCKRDMHRACVIKHNLEISRMLQVHNHMTSSMMGRAQ